MDQVNGQLDGNSSERPTNSAGEEERQPAPIPKDVQEPYSMIVEELHSSALTEGDPIDYMNRIQYMTRRVWASWASIGDTPEGRPEWAEVLNSPLEPRHLRGKDEFGERTQELIGLPIARVVLDSLTYSMQASIWSLDQEHFRVIWDNDGPERFDFIDKSLGPMKAAMRIVNQRISEMYPDGLAKPKSETEAAETAAKEEGDALDAERYGIERYTDLLYGREKPPLRSLAELQRAADLRKRASAIQEMCINAIGELKDLLAADPEDGSYRTHKARVTFFANQLRTNAGEPNEELFKKSLEIAMTESLGESIDEVEEEQPEYETEEDQLFEESEPNDEFGEYSEFNFLNPLNSAPAHQDELATIA